MPKKKANLLVGQVSRAVGAGCEVELSTVDFSDPQRPKTCLEVDFPILPVNRVAPIEGNAGKPIYQMSKWWARRRSSVFRTLLLAAATKAPEDPSESAKVIWDAYYANHQKKRSFANLKVADIFMGGGTTVIEGSRLGMQVSGNDLSPVAWFVVKTELAPAQKAEVEALFAAIEAEVKSQIMPFYACRGPHGEHGTWTRLSDGNVMGEDFDASALNPEERKGYRYDGPTIVCVFWAKHSPCQVLGCGHRTPIMASPLISVKEFKIKAWSHVCSACQKPFDVEECDTRIAPDAPLVVAAGESAHAVLKRGIVENRHSFDSSAAPNSQATPDSQRTPDSSANPDSRATADSSAVPDSQATPDSHVTCPACRETQPFVPTTAPSRKTISTSLLIHPSWFEGTPSTDFSAQPLGGRAADDADANARWHHLRSSGIRLLEVRGPVPSELTCPDTDLPIKTAEGTVPKKSHVACGACGNIQDVLTTVAASGTTASCAAYAVQAWSPRLQSTGSAYGGRFFTTADPDTLAAAELEWAQRSRTDLAQYWPTTSIPEGLETTVRTPLHKYGYKQWNQLFNARQLLTHALILRAIDTLPGFSTEAREVALAAFQQYLRNNNMFCIWNIQRDTLEPFLSKNNLQPPTRPVENSVFGKLGRGNWSSCSAGVLESISWREEPWELVARDALPPELIQQVGTAKSVRVPTGDPLMSNVDIRCASSTDASLHEAGSIDLVVTDPPFGDIMQYSELSGLFYAWLRIPLGKRYPAFQFEQPPSALEAVENASRHGRDSNDFYRRVLTDCWKEAHRILRPGGILTFTFHHDKDKPWVAVLESLFNAGFYLEATYPVRSDETKGEGGTPGTFGAQKVEFDVVHVCRKRTEDPQPVSWAKMRRQVLQDVRALKHMLEDHQKAGLPEADLQVIRRGKALEYFSRHYGKVLIDDGHPMRVIDALVGINQLLEEEAGAVKDPPPANAEPFTRQFLRLFEGVTELPRDQIQKYLRGTGLAPADFEERGWCVEQKKIYQLISPLTLAQGWAGKHRRGMTSDYDQAAFFIGACFEGSGINASDTLSNDNFKPHPALPELIDWFTTRGPTPEIRNAAARAKSILRTGRAKHDKGNQQINLFVDDQNAA